MVVTEKLFLHSVNEPLYECFASEEMFDVGIGNVLISRQGEGRTNSRKHFSGRHLLFGSEEYRLQFNVTV